MIATSIPLPAPALCEPAPTRGNQAPTLCESAAAQGEPAADLYESAAAQATDPDAVFERHAAALHRYLFVRCGDSHLTDDLMQQLWIQLHRGGRNVPPEELEFWLRRVARNLLSAIRRSNGRAPAQRAPADPALAAELAERMAREELPPTLLEQQETREQLLLALTALPTAEQELIIEHYFDGRPLAQIAAAMQISERAVEGRLYRARRALRDRLAHLDE